MNEQKISKIIKRSVRNGINAILNKVNYELVRKRREFCDFINFQNTIKAAKEARLSVCDFIDKKYNVPGETDRTIEKMDEFCIFRDKITRICEIGPGSGRYLEKVQKKCNPEFYEIYETAENWKNWLVEKYNVVAQPCDGLSLKATADRTVDLVHSHKVFPGLPVLTILRYFIEMIRIARENAWIVFDILTEDTLDDSTLKIWLDSGIRYPCSLIPKQYGIEFFEKRGFVFCGSFIINMKPGYTNYFVFRGKGGFNI